MSSSFSKPLSKSDDSGFEFAQEMLQGDATYAINFDRIQFHPKLGYIIFEYLLCDEKQTVTPYSSHPNRYFHKNSRKFISLFRVSRDLNATLYLVNYAKKGTRHENEVLLMRVISVDENNYPPIQTEDVRTTRLEFSAWFRELNCECRG